jgi:hypothetical protein
MADEFTWVRNEDTGGYARLPVAALKYWTVRGWVVCDPPPETDPTRVHMAERFGLDVADEPADAPQPDAAPADVPPASKSKKSGTAGVTEGV